MLRTTDNTFVILEIWRQNEGRTSGATRSQKVQHLSMISLSSVAVFIAVLTSYLLRCFGEQSQHRFLLSFRLRVYLPPTDHVSTMNEHETGGLFQTFASMAT